MDPPGPWDRSFAAFGHGESHGSVLGRKKWSWRKFTPMDGGSRYIRYLESTYKLINISCFFLPINHVKYGWMMFCDFVAPMVSVHQYEKYRFSYHWCYNQHMQRSCYSHAWLPKGRFFSTDERQATICNTWVQLSTHFSSWTLSPLFSQESSLLHFGVFFVVSHVFSTQKQSSKPNTSRSWRSRVFHFGTSGCFRK